MMLANSKADDKICIFENKIQEDIISKGEYKLTMIILYVVGGLLMLLGIMLILLDNLFFMF